MTTAKRIIFAGAVAGVVLFVSCGKKPPEMPAIIFGTDTLMAGQVARFDPSGTDDRARLRNVGTRLLCAGGLPQNSGDSLIRLFAERLLLVTGAEWDRDAAALLLNASLTIHTSDRIQSCEQVMRYADSLRSRLGQIVTGSAGAAPVPEIMCDSAGLKTDTFMSSLLQTVLGVQPELAGLILEFLAPPAESQSLTEGKDMKAIISGLVSKGGIPAEDTGKKPKAGVKTSTGKQAIEPKDNSTEVLRYRDQQSIRDTIEKHIPDLRQLYKKSLKSGDAFGGKIVVTIRVDAAGEVIQTAIKATTIDNKLFLDPFIGYVRTIRFKPVAEKLGAMTFDFPFEFNAEM